MNMDEECTTTFSVDEQHAEVDTNRSKSVASLNRPIGRFDKELPSGDSLLSERCQPFCPKGQNHSRFRIRLAGTPAGAEPPRPRIRPHHRPPPPACLRPPGPRPRYDPAPSPP